MKTILYSAGEPGGIGPDIIIQLAQSSFWEQSKATVFESQFGFHFLEVLGKRNYEKTFDIIEDQAYNILFSRKYDEELENSLRTMRAEAFVEFKDLD